MLLSRRARGGAARTPAPSASPPVAAMRPRTTQPAAGFGAARRCGPSAAPRSCRGDEDAAAAMHDQPNPQPTNASPHHHQLQQRQPQREWASRLRSAAGAAMLSAALVGGPLAMDAASPAPAAAETEASRRAVDEYLEMESSGRTGSVKELQAIRSKYRFRRTADGRVELRSSRGDWWSVRLDMEVPGAMLLRDPSGKVFAVQTDTVQQIDLSEDLICLMMFADGNWEAQMAPIEYADGGKVKQLKLDEKEFREVIGILNEAGEALSEAGNA